MNRKVRVGKSTREQVKKNNGERPRVRRKLTKAGIRRRREVQLAYYYRNRKLSPEYLERQAEYDLFAVTGLKKCKICLEHKSPEDFYPTKVGAYRLTDDCKECRTSISLENYYRRKSRKQRG